MRQAQGLAPCSAACVLATFILALAKRLIDPSATLLFLLLHRSRNSRQRFKL